jgi:hypothetical protein
LSPKGFVINRVEDRDCDPENFSDLCQ